MATGPIKKTTIDDLITRETIYFQSSTGISAGTIGTRGLQMTQSVSYVPKSLVITYIGDSSAILPIVFYYNGMIYCNIYRCTSGSIAAANTHVTVIATH